MSLVDLAQPEVTNADVANRIREHFACVIGTAEVKLQQIRNLVRECGRSAISAQLGSEAQNMLAVYTKLKEAIEAAKAITVDDLP